MVAVALIGIAYFLQAFNIMEPTAPANNTTVGQQYDTTTGIIVNNVPWIPALLFGIVGLVLVRVVMVGGE